MFGREKTRAPEATTAAQAEAAAKLGGKGRPTPKRSEAQARNRVPLVGAPALKPNATKEEKKAAKAAQREANRKMRLEAQAGAARGDARYLPVRDQGPARALTRDIVDARRNLGEVFLPIAVVSFVLTLIATPFTRVAGAVLLYGLVLGIVADSFLLSRKVRKVVVARYGETEAKGVGLYGSMRAIQFRRGRRPLPRVERGAKLEQSTT